MAMIIPTDEIRRAGEGLSELSDRMSRLASRADQLNSAIAGCFMQGGVGGRAGTAAGRMRSQARAASQRGEVLRMAADLYEIKEEQLNGQSRLAAGKIGRGLDVVWMTGGLMAAVLASGGVAAPALSSLSRLGKALLSDADVSAKLSGAAEKLGELTRPNSVQEAGTLAEAMRRDERTSRVDVPLHGQQTNYTCGSASGVMILESLGVEGVSEKNFWDHANANGQGTYVYRIQQTLNQYCGQNAYSYRTTYSLPTEEYYDVISKSLDAGYPVELPVSIPDRDYFGYDSDGHYVVVTEVYVNENDVYMAKINDPFSKYGVNHPQTVDIPLETLHGYNKRHSGYIIYHDTAQ